MAVAPRRERKKAYSEPLRLRVTHTHQASTMGALCAQGASPLARVGSSQELESKLLSMCERESTEHRLECLPGEEPQERGQPPYIGEGARRRILDS